jgi:hypothetical protein
MSVVSVTGIESELEVSDDGHRNYTSTYEIITDSKQDSPLIVIAAAGIPVYQAGYAWGTDSDPEALRTRTLSVKPRGVQESRRTWRVTVKHSTKAEGCKDADDLDPLSKPLVLSGAFAAFTKAAVDDKVGDALLTSSDEPIIPPLEIDDSRDTLSVEFNTLTLDLQVRSSLRDRCNSNTMWGLAARAIKLAKWGWSREFYGQCYPYFKNSLEFAINIDLWNSRVLDQGWREKLGVGADGKPIYSVITEKDQPVHQPVLLDGAGRKRAAGFAPVFFTKEIVKEADLSVIGLPDPLW